MLKRSGWHVRQLKAADVYRLTRMGGGGGTPDSNWGAVGPGKILFLPHGSADHF
jgi:ribosomal protein L16/L10AE